MSDVPYHYARFRYSHFKDDWQPFFDLLAVGKPAPDFEIKDDHGRTVRLSDFKGKIVVIESGSMSCPMYIQSIPGMNDAFKKHPDVVFLVLYTREAHPGEKLPALVSISEKIHRVTRLKREEPENRIILIDDMDGTMHHAYGKMPNSAVIVDKEGRIAFHAQWNDPVAIDNALARMKNDQPLNGVKPVYKRPKPPLAFRTFRRAGFQSLIDFFVGLPRILYHHWKYD